MIAILVKSHTFYSSVFWLLYIKKIKNPTNRDGVL